jgi:hypothetical protein
MQSGNLRLAVVELKCTPQLLAGTSSSQFPDDLDILYTPFSIVAQLWALSETTCPDLVLAPDHRYIRPVTSLSFASSAILVNLLDCTFAKSSATFIPFFVRFMVHQGFSRVRGRLLRLRSLSEGYDRCDTACCLVVQA